MELVFEEAELFDELVVVLAHGLDGCGLATDDRARFLRVAFALALQYAELSLESMQFRFR